MTSSGDRSRGRLSAALKAEALRLGFDACGVSAATRLDPEARRLEEWLNRSRHGTMTWMERHFDERIDPRVLVPGARTVVSVLHSYRPSSEPSTGPDVGRISRYAWGDDYHDVVKERLAELYAWLVAQGGDVHGRAFVDSAPLMDKAWAARSGLGWQGKHTNLISRKHGSWFFIGTLVIDLDLEPDGPVPDHCGTCTRCIDACPTGALEPYRIDASRCISYLTIEHRPDDIPEELARGLGNWIFGCDVCQEVCPWNRFSRPTTETRYTMRPGLDATPLEAWEELDLEGYRALFRRSAVKRAKFEGLKRNVRLALANRHPGTE